MNRRQEALGINVLYKKIGFNVMVFMPMAQDIYNGQTRLQKRTLFGLTYSF